METPTEKTVPPTGKTVGTRFSRVPYSSSTYRAHKQRVFEPIHKNYEYSQPKYQILLHQAHSSWLKCIVGLMAAAGCWLRYHVNKIAPKSMERHCTQKCIQLLPFSYNVGRHNSGQGTTLKALLPQAHQILQAITQNTAWKPHFWLSLIGSFNVYSTFVINLLIQLRVLSIRPTLYRLVFKQACLSHHSSLLSSSFQEKTNDAL